MPIVWEIVFLYPWKRERPSYISRMRGKPIRCVKMTKNKEKQENINKTVSFTFHGCEALRYRHCGQNSGSFEPKQTVPSFRYSLNMF